MLKMQCLVSKTRDFIPSNVIRCLVVQCLQGNAYDLDSDSDYADDNGNVGNTRIDTYADDGNDLPFNSWTTVRLRVSFTNTTTTTTTQDGYFCFE